MIYHSPSRLINLNTKVLPLLVCSSLIVVVALGLAPAYADNSIPFVIGHERFGRHADIDQVTSGRLLITELSCTACHTSPNEVLKPKSGPSLAGAGVRLKPAWIESYLVSHSSVDPGTTMPSMLLALPQEQRAVAARALSTYLGSLIEPYPEPKATGANPVPLDFAESGDPNQGKRLFHTIGCVACHEPSQEFEVAPVQPSDLDKLIETLEPEELKELGLSSAARKVDSIPLPSLPEKYSRKSLTYFLLYPDHVRPSSRMPSFSLKPVEAADIAAYLIPSSKNRPIATVKKPSTNNVVAMIASGKRLFTELRCANCHIVDAKQTPLAASARPLMSLKLEAPNSCVTIESTEKLSSKRGQPIYQLDESQLSALAAALSPKAGSTTKNLDIQLSLLQLNCFSCHERNDLGGVDRYRKPYFETVNNIDIGDEGRLPPTLTGVGRRLNSAWMESVLKGEAAIRPHMTVRMPVYNKSYTKSLPVLFESQDRLASDKQLVGGFAKADQKTLVEAGRTLMDSGCIQCHKFRGHALPGVVGVDLNEIDKRVQTQWLHDFLLDPGALKKRTRMPSFFPEGKSQNPDILNGNTELQLAAMAAYISDLKNQPLPQKIEEARSQSYELVPRDAPIVIRTFMPVGGLHSIAVGFPESWHFAFDSERCSIAEAWRGKFLDAETTWFDRFARPTQPLGNKPVQFLGGPSVSVLPQKNSPWPAAANATASKVRFQGYELDDSGIPSFRYTASQFEILERIQPYVAQGEVIGLQRTLVAVQAAPGAQPAQLWFRALADKKPSQVTSRPENSRAALVTSDGLKVVLMSNIPFGEVRNIAGQTEWIIPFPFDGNQPVTLEMLYQWK